MNSKQVLPTANSANGGNKSLNNISIPALSDGKLVGAFKNPFKNPFRIRGVMYKLEFNGNVMAELEERYTSFKEWEKLVQLQSTNDIFYGATLMLNEYAKIYNERNPSKTQKPLLDWEDDADAREIRKKSIYKVSCEMTAAMMKYMYADE